MEGASNDSVENPIVKNPAKKQKLSTETDDSLPQVSADQQIQVLNLFEPKVELESTPIKAQRPPKAMPLAPKKEFVRRLKFPLKISEDGSEDYFMYISSYDGLKRPSAATLELVRHKDGDAKYKLSLSYNELEWLLANLPSGDEMAEQRGKVERCSVSRNNLTTEIIQATSGYVYVKLQTETRYKKFMLIGSAIADEISHNAGKPFSLLTQIESFKKSSAELYGQKVAALFFAALPHFDALENMEWKGIWRKIAPLFGLTDFLAEDKNLNEAKILADSYVKGTVPYPAEAHIMGTVFRSLE